MHKLPEQQWQKKSEAFKIYKRATHKRPASLAHYVYAAWTKAAWKTIRSIMQA